jgi:hypothetical protein
MSITVLFNASRPPKIGDSHASNKVRKRGGVRVIVIGTIHTNLVTMWL